MEEMREDQDEYPKPELPITSLCGG
jgi:hypothetical protein